MQVPGHLFSLKELSSERFRDCSVSCRESRRVSASKPSLPTPCGWTSSPGCNKHTGHRTVGTSLMTEMAGPPHGGKYSRRNKSHPPPPACRQKHTKFPALPSGSHLYACASSFSHRAHTRWCSLPASLSMLFQGSKNAQVAFSQPILFRTCYEPGTLPGSQEKSGEQIGHCPHQMSWGNRH